MNTTEFMKETYGALNEIETGLRQYIELTMITTYGVGWFTSVPLTMKYKPYRKHFDVFEYYELISMLKAYPCFDDIPSDVYSQLLKTVPTRNKIVNDAEKVPVNFKSKHMYEIYLKVYI
ncbi:hypothetical protein SAMN04488072_101431 [Lentibacillus halodurans]|uniref:Uncharacterized protein n=1 Tax=Lentibacillus halodurans TaxID=237679 RepID=A0A1I0VHY0_9BACI|nr:hypothetical protein [Lentibacillus halodurans]SFA75922.1 hypothetical protein SAMN04488072_101431 [Lentibacillus halodurans]